MVEKFWKSPLHKLYLKIQECKTHTSSVSRRESSTQQLVYRTSPGAVNPTSGFYSGCTRTASTKVARTRIYGARCRCFLFYFLPTYREYVNDTEAHFRHESSLDGFLIFPCVSPSPLFFYRYTQVYNFYFFSELFDRKKSSLERAVCPPKKGKKFARSVRFSQNRDKSARGGNGVLLGERERESEKK